MDSWSFFEGTSGVLCQLSIWNEQPIEVKVKLRALLSRVKFSQHILITDPQRTRLSAEPRRWRMKVEGPQHSSSPFHMEPQTHFLFSVRDVSCSNEFESTLFHATRLQGEHSQTISESSLASMCPDIIKNQEQSWFLISQFLSSSLPPTPFPISSPLPPEWGLENCILKQVHTQMCYVPDWNITWGLHLVTELRRLRNLGHLCR